jgi:hypothetical protein
MDYKELSGFLIFLLITLKMVAKHVGVQYYVISTFYIHVMFGLIA